MTDTFSWHWLFLVNIVPGLLVATVVWVTIDINKPDLSLLRDFDVTGLLLMATFLGCLQYALQEGPRSVGSAATPSAGPSTSSMISAGRWRQPVAGRAAAGELAT